MGVELPAQVRIFFLAMQTKQEGLLPPALMDRYAVSASFVPLVPFNFGTGRENEGRDSPEN